MMKATDSKGRTVLDMAALSGDKGTFDTVLSVVKQELIPSEVRHPRY